MTDSNINMIRITESDHCLGCLCSSKENKIYDYKIKYAHFRVIFEVASIKLCHICKRLAEHAELFIQNVQSNQILLENSLEDICTTIQEAHSQFEPPIILSATNLETISISSKESSDSTPCGDFEVTCSSNPTPRNTRATYKHSKVTCDSINSVIKPIESNVKTFDSDVDDVHVNNNQINVCTNKVFLNHNKIDIKLELKEEIELEHLEGEFVDDSDDFQDPYLKEEDDYPLQDLLKKEVEVVGSKLQTIKTIRKRKLKRKTSKNRVASKKITNKIKSKLLYYDDEIGIEKFYITLDQCMEERKQQMLDPKYMDCTLKCEDCVKGFKYRVSYEMHMQKHGPAMGAFVCDICKLRMNTEEKLQGHKKYHTERYKCTECGLVRICRLTIKDHYAAYHRQGEAAYQCSYCKKTFKRQASLRKHVKYTHMKQERVTCDYCHKSYANKNVLKSHIMLIHPKEVSAPEIVKRYHCKDCGKYFKSPSLLKLHGTKHSTTRNFYCVECDKAFKSESALKQHLKIAQPHVNYSELPLSCLQCDKKFSIRRDLDRHMNRVHLDIKPFTCDKCDKAYVNNWSLIDHKRRIHDGYRRPLQYPCKICDKIFDRNSILKAHIRTHTGERPYKCTKCPAQFTQSGVLATHNKLIHLKLTRDGKPKANTMK